MRWVPLVCTKGSWLQIRRDPTCHKSLPSSSHETLAMLAATSGAISLPHPVVGKSTKEEHPCETQEQPSGGDL